MHHVARFRQNHSHSCRDITIFTFLKMTAVRDLGFVGHVIWNTHVQYWVVLVILQNLAVMDAVVLDIMKVLIFCAFGLKMPIHASQNEVFWGV